MSQLLTVLIMCCSSFSVLAYIAELKEKFKNIEMETAHYAELNDQFTEKLIEAEENFNRMLRQKSKKEKSLSQIIQIEVKDLKDLHSNLTIINFEMKQVEREHDLETFNQQRNQLIITLLKQDIEVLANRSQHQLNKNCIELDNQVSPLIVLRSSAGDDSELVVLKSILNRKLTNLNRAKNEYKKLHEELNYKQNTYRLTLNDVQNYLENSTVDLIFIRKNVAELLTRLNNATQEVAGMKFELLEQLKENTIQGKKIKELKSNLQEFSRDIACYQKIVSEDFLHIASD